VHSVESAPLEYRGVSRLLRLALHHW